MQVPASVVLAEDLGGELAGAGGRAGQEGLKALLGHYRGVSSCWRASLGMGTQSGAARQPRERNEGALTGKPVRPRSAVGFLKPAASLAPAMAPPPPLLLPADIATRPVPRPALAQ